MSLTAAGLTGAIRAEFMKLLTTKLWWILLLILVAYVAFTAGILGLAFGGLLPGEELPAEATVGLPAVVYSVATSIGYVIPVILGTLAVTGEHRHQTLTPTFLATPRRGQVLFAKLVALAVFGAIYGVAALIGTVGVGAPILALADVDPALGNGDTWLLFARIVLAMALWAVIGVGIGTLIPGQIAAIIVLLAFTQFVEPILRTVLSLVDGAAGIAKFLPGAAGDALVGSSIFTMLGGGGGADVLEWWQGGLVLLALAVVASIIGYATSWRKDVT